MLRDWMIALLCGTPWRRIAPPGPANAQAGVDAGKAFDLAGLGQLMTELFA